MIQEWPTFSASDSKHCIAEATMGGESSRAAVAQQPINVSPILGSIKCHLPAVSGLNRR
jgi:hypothetical protein